MFKRVLIANRGEIACRVIATTRRRDIATVGVYSDADKEPRHVKLVYEAVRISAAPSRESYLLADRIIAAAKQIGAQSIYPGHYFLIGSFDRRKKARRARVRTFCQPFRGQQPGDPST
ncbi:Carbamoyl-phosphate synthetase large chain domain protein [Paracidovorax avenae ATCC 19860]|uniref:Carbamoyl-phosphate synthetase large chain domain protein n=1 Tax=Paracidovorax avenae (strain ATCC 19860 / DSM 7227 / CCUG 15838 / JCM 20985 / LMG 2117 / NCPPB 1011) TaxID=643561 RepID=F0Q2G5_PARA1|nr:Carbamoyl-phosphate synthetase large chain domain protein [Paracidovorax avenae ATCC 19860]